METGPTDGTVFEILKNSCLINFRGIIVHEVVISHLCISSPVSGLAGHFQCLVHSLDTPLCGHTRELLSGTGGKIEILGLQILVCSIQLNIAKLLSEVM
jgi:hypothetical protein